jgi:hypothetical protein
MEESTDSSADGASGGHLARWLVLVALAVLAAAFGRQLALGSADRRFEQRLRELDENRG